MTSRIRLAPRQLVVLAVPFAGVCVGSVIVRTDHHTHWMAAYADLVGTAGIAANLVFQYVALRLLMRVLERRGMPMLRGIEPSHVVALLAVGTALAAACVLGAVRVNVASAPIATALFPGASLVAAMALAPALVPAQELPARRALVLVFASQFALTLALRVL